MSPNARERAYEKRRYEEWQAKLSARKAQRRRARLVSLSIVATVLVILVIGGTFFLVAQNHNDDTSTAASATPAASATAAPAATAAAAATQAPGGCPPSTLPASVANPKTYTLPNKATAAGKTFTLTLETTCGQIVMALDGTKAPQAVASTVFLATSGFYDKTPCPRISSAQDFFVLQCGDPNGDGTSTPGYSFGPLENVPADSTYKAGDVAMARGSTPDSQGSQFFIVYRDTKIDTIVLGTPA